MRRKFYPIVLLVSLIASMLFASPTLAAPVQAPEPPYNTVTIDATDASLSMAPSVVQLGENDMLVIRLKVNPSTGYRWVVQDMDAKILARPKGQALEMEAAKSSLLGAPTVQILRFYGVATGKTTLNMAYMRAWETGVEPLQTYSIQVESMGAFKGVPVAPEAPAAASIDPALNAPSTNLALPTYYNVCDNGGCTTPKDQGSCGSCWSFGTMGVFEQAIKKIDGLTKDLSEQYLVSCNTDGYGCDGGWWAHEYNVSKIPTGETAAGAVYEAAFPYTATDSACNAPHTHNEKLSSWAYVGTSSSVPSTTALKQAIYDHGAVAAAVCVGDAFQDYSSGIFQTNECTTVNHAIILVGWDDTNGVWYLRNSWGPTWGESGYMRIKYGTSSVGYGATYIVYAGAGTPTPTPTTGPTPDYLIVDDDLGKTYQTYYASALTALSKSYDTWTVATQGSPTAATLQKYKVVIWLTGDDYSTTLTATDITNLTTYLNAGGKLFISGQDIGYNLKSNAFYASYLHASYLNDDTNVTDLSGADFLSGTTINISSGDGANNQSYPSEIGLANSGVGIFDYSGSTYGWGGVAYSGAYKVVYLSFGFEGVNSATSRSTLMSKILAYLQGSTGPTATPTPIPPTPTFTPTPTRTPTPTFTPTPVANQILLVDDDLNKTYQTYYANALTAMGKSFDTWTVYSQGSPTAATLQKYRIVIWLTGDDYSTTLASTDITNLTTYLNGGGRLFISGQDIGYHLKSSTFLTNYLHAGFKNDDTNTYAMTGSGLLAGSTFSISGGDGAANQGYPSEITVGTGATGIVDYNGSTYGWGGVSYSGTYKVVFFAFGFEAISTAATRNSVMSTVITWLNN